MVEISLDSTKQHGQIIMYPNRSASWQSVKRFLWVISIFAFTIAFTFAFYGLWMVLPFAGLEILALVLLRELDRCLEQAGVRVEWNDLLRDLKALQRMELQEGPKRMWVRSQVQGSCAQVFKAVGLALPPVLQLADAWPLQPEPEGEERDQM